MSGVALIAPRDPGDRRTSVGGALYALAMVKVHHLSRRDARRVAVSAQLLTRQRPTDLLDTVRRLSLLQIDHTSAVAPSADLVLWSRLGSSYSAQDLRDAVDEQRLLEFRGTLRPVEDLVLYRAEMADWPGVGDLRDWQVHRREWLRANDSFRRDVLDLLRREGPLRQREVPDTCAVPWSSSGWNNNKNVVMMLDFLVLRGEVAVAGRDGRDKLWDLASRIYPDDPVVPSDEARVLRDERRLSALGIARSHGPECPVEPLDVDQAGEPATVEGTRGEWRVDPRHLGQRFAGRAALLSPFDRLLHDRKRMAQVFEFDYQLEMFKPAAARRWGYYALPILYGDRLVGKVDASADRAAGELRVAALHRDVEFTATMSAAVDREIRDLARWLDLDLVLPG
jgi:uncharacterized protein YcaQ